MFEQFEDLSKEELLNFMGAYDIYIDNFDYASGEPVCMLEFYDNEYQDIIKGE